MNWMQRSKLAVFLTVLFGFPCAVKAQYRNYSLRCLAPIVENVDESSPQTLQEALFTGPKYLAIPLEGIGSEAIQFPISSESDDAGKFFIQGIALLHVLDYGEAARAFRTVVELDPKAPMGYWGLAQANEKKPGRAAVFARAAAERCDRNRPELEQRWTRLLAKFYDSDADLNARTRARIQALETLSLDFPDAPEVRAFLNRRLTLDQFFSGLEISSTLGVDTLLRDFSEDAPTHPSRHYRVFLWFQRRADRILTDANQMTQLSPAAAEIWRYSAEAHRFASRTGDAVRFATTALQVEHAQLALQSSMPWESGTLLDNHLALIDLLTESGQIDQALIWADRALALPNKLEGEQVIGEEIRCYPLMISGQWEQLRDDLISSKVLNAGQSYRSRATRFAMNGFAQLALGQHESAASSLIELRELEREALINGVSRRQELEIANRREALEESIRFFETRKEERTFPALLNSFFPPLARAQLLIAAGHDGEAFRVAETEFGASPYRTMAAALYIQLSRETGRVKEASFHFDRRFRSGIRLMDPDLPVMSHLKSIAADLRLPRDWQVGSEKDQHKQNDREKGPEKWEAPKAPGFQLLDRRQQIYQLSQYSNRPVLLNFFLGVNCAFCLEQIEQFQPVIPQFKEAGVQLLGVSIDDRETLARVLGTKTEKDPAFRDRIPFPVLADPELKVFKDYQVFDDFEKGPMHATVLISPSGRILWKNIGHQPFSDAEALLNETQRLLNLTE